jgi:7-cyano-7-deazaguanine synthase
MKKIYPQRSRVLLSGGMDSAVCLAWTIKHLGKYDNVVDAVCFDYGQRHAVQELDSAKRIAATARVPLTIYDIRGGVGDWHPGDSSLVGSGEGSLLGGDVVVDGRNRALIVSAALLHDPTLPDAIVFGACADDHEIFADCRPEFFRSVEEELRIPIHTPLIDKTKRDVVELAASIGATNLIVRSWSCYAGGEVPCGNCGACAARAQAFAAPCGVCDECNAGTRCRELPQ